MIAANSGLYFNCKIDAIIPTFIINILNVFLKASTENTFQTQININTSKWNLFNDNDNAQSALLPSSSRVNAWMIMRCNYDNDYERAMS